jgi:hypothetical protein
MAEELSELKRIDEVIIISGVVFGENISAGDSGTIGDFMLISAEFFSSRGEVLGTWEGSE